MRVLYAEEQRKSVASLMDEPDAFKIGTLIALVTGIRFGELCALRWRDVSFKDKTIQIAYTMQSIKSTKEGAEKKSEGYYHCSKK